jgi:hypothetical protein
MPTGSSDVINFGVLDDPLKGLPDAIAHGQDIALKKKQAKTSEMNAKNRQMMLQAELAKIQRQNDDDDYKHTQTSLKQVAALKDSDPLKYAQFMASDNGKEFLTHVKKIMPEVVNDDTKNPVDKLNLYGYSPKELASQKINQIKVDYLTAVKSGKPVDPNLTKAYQAIQTHGSDDLASAFADASKMTSSVDQASLAANVKSQLALRQQMRNNQSPSTTQNSTSQALSSPSGQNQNNDYTKYLTSIQGQ